VEPASDLAGPGVVDGAISRCFSHDPEGALVAAVRLQAQIAGATALSWPEASAALAPGRFTDAINAEEAQLLSQPQAPSDTDRPLAAVAGFRFLSYSPEIAVIALAYRSENGALYTADQTLAWVDGDWHLVPVGPDAISSPQASVPDLAGFVEWKQP